MSDARDAQTPAVGRQSVDRLLERMSDALSIAATAASALQAAEDPTAMEEAAERADKICCLVHGIAELRRALAALREHLEDTARSEEDAT